MPGITTATRTNGIATIDAVMVVVKTRETSPKTLAFNSSQKVGIETQIETHEAIKLVVKNSLKAQKPEQNILTGHIITITDQLTQYELLPLFNGGSVKTDPKSGAVTGYTAPKVGEEVKRVKCDVTVYTARMSGSTILNYEATTYPNCEGQPYGLSAEDDNFRNTELKLISTPGDGEAAYTMEVVDALPNLQDPTPGGAGA